MNKLATFNDVAALQLSALCRATGHQEEFPEYLKLQKFLFENWGDREIPAQPQYLSLVSDDHTPYEYSLAFGAGGIELRLLMEAQADVPSLQSNQAAALSLTEQLAKAYPVDVKRLKQVSDLFCPSQPQGLFSLWHAACLRKGERPDFKIYLNPRVQGSDKSHEVLAEALERLGFSNALSRLQEFAWRGGELDELMYFSLDLAEDSRARVKIYHSHHHASAEDIERSFSAAPTHQAGDVCAYFDDMLGHRGPLMRKPPVSCLAFVAGSAEPLSVTLHLPLGACLKNDARVAERVEGFLTKHKLPVASYRAVMATFPQRPLERSIGVQSYASYRRDRAGGMRLTVYLTPMTYQDRRCPASVGHEEERLYAAA